MERKIYMFHICLKINGQQHCFDLPSLVDIHPPHPNNFPELEAAVAILDIVAVIPQSEFSQKLSRLANAHIEQVRQGLPAGVELRTGQTA
jgi:hypothetical protein